MPALAPRLATNQPIDCERRSGDGAMLLKCLERIRRASWLKAAGVAKPGAEQQAIRFDQPHQGLSRQAINSRQTVLHTTTGMGLGRAQAVCIKTSNSARTASFNAVEDALTYSLRENSRRSLTRKAACGRGDVKLALTV